MNFVKFMQYFNQKAFLKKSAIMKEFISLFFSCMGAAASVHILIQT